MTLRTGEVYISEQGEGFVIPEAISLFGFSISFYGLFLVLAALIGIIVITKEAHKRKQSVEWSLTLVTLVIVSALLGARVYYMMFQWEVFVADPLVFLDFRSGGLAYFGALFGAWCMVKWYCRRKNEPFAPNADMLCIGAAFAAPFIWTGCAFVREPLGRFYDGFFSVRISSEYLTEEIEEAEFFKMMSQADRMQDKFFISMHPVAIYGVVSSLLVLIVLCFYKYRQKRDGELFVMYLWMNAAVFLVLEHFRADRYCIWGTKIPVNYVVSGVLLLMIAYGWGKQFFNWKKFKKRLFM